MPLNYNCVRVRKGHVQLRPILWGEKGLCSFNNKAYAVQQTRDQYSKSLAFSPEAFLAMQSPFEWLISNLSDKTKQISVEKSLPADTDFRDYGDAICTILQN